MTKRIFSFFVLLATGFALFISCNKTVTSEEEVQPEAATTTTATLRLCAAQEVLDEQMRQDPGLRQRMDKLEEFTRQFAEKPE